MTGFKGTPLQERAQMTAKKTTLPSQAFRTMLRRAAGRHASKFTLGGREKRRTRPLPSLPKLTCLETSELKPDGGEER